MKRLSLVLTIATVLGTATAYAGWWKTFGNEGSEGGRCVQITSDSNYMICGSKDDSLWLIKTDTSGTTIWDRVYNFDTQTHGRWLEETKDGGYIIASRSPSLVKVDMQGDTQWVRDFNMVSYCTQSISDGGYIVVGGNKGNESSDDSLILVRVTSNGDLLWRRTYTEPGKTFHLGFFIQVTADGGLIVTGQTVYLDPDYYSLTAIWLVKTDSEGNVLWSKNFAEDWETYCKGLCVKQTEEGGYLITGYLGGLVLLKTDSNGDSLWTKVYNSPWGGVGYSIQEIEDGFVIAGATQNPTAYLQETGRNLWLLKTDDQCDTFWTRIYGGDGYDVGRCALQTKDEGYIVTGYTTSFGVGGSADIWLLKTDSLGLLGVSEEPSPDLDRNWELISSLGSQIVLRYSNNPSGFNAVIFDAAGRKVDTLRSTDRSGMITWGFEYPSGVYFIQTKETNSVHTERVVLIR